MRISFQELKGRTIKVAAPGTVANLVCGFDVLGLCLHNPFDEMTVTIIPEKTVKLQSADGYPLPTDPMQNTAGAPLIEMLQELDADFGFDVLIHKKIKPGSGVGSSAAVSYTHLDVYKRQKYYSGNCWQRRQKSYQYSA